MMKKSAFLFPLLLILPLAQAAPPHVHGAARLEITLEQQRLEILLESPLDNLVGFEHAPRTQRERQTLAATRARLENPAEVFTLEADAQCVPQPATVTIQHEADGHGEIEAKYLWDCARPQALQAITLRLFARFPRLRHVDVEFAGESGQKAGRLSAAAARFGID
jgi:hypothetical protein